ncbi:MAG: 30S ribosomal protein S3 [Candidatus Fonsibacter sp.]|jgi:small subunit ribosomal protein S3|nr:30S ribosomal protein S3 [Pelagibacterales bacterium]
MGQKVNPIGLRLNINKNWNSLWFAKKKEYGQYLIEDFKIRKYIKNNLKNSGISKIFIERPTKKCIVTIFTSRPGFVIGKKGSDIDKIKTNLSKISTSEISVNIKEIRKPELDAYLVAENIAQQLEKRIAYRKAMKRAMQSTLRLGAKGIKVTVAGRLAGAEIARTEWLREGSIPLHTLRAEVDYGEAEAETTYGIIGVKVWIYKGMIFEKDKKKIDDQEVTTNKELNNATASKN